MEKDELAELGGDEFEIIIGVGVDAGVIMDVGASPNIVDSSGFRLSSLSFRFISS